MQQYEQQGANVIVLDAPTLIESGLYKDCNKTIAVVAPMPVRLERIMQRDKLTEEQALLRMHAQPQDSFCVAVRYGIRWSLCTFRTISTDSRFIRGGKGEDNGKYICEVSKKAF